MKTPTDKVISEFRKKFSKYYHLLGALPPQDMEDWLITFTTAHQREVEEVKKEREREIVKDLGNELAMIPEGINDLLNGERIGLRLAIDRVIKQNHDT